jgi:hypothetical protein
LPQAAAVNSVKKVRWFSADGVTPGTLAAPAAGHPVSPTTISTLRPRYFALSAVCSSRCSSSSRAAAPSIR